MRLRRRLRLARFSADRTMKILTLLFLLAAPLFAISGSGIPKGDDWAPWARGQLEKIRELPPAERYQKARKWLFLGRRGANLLPDEREVWHQAQELIMSEPGYAWRVYNEIQESQRELLEVLEGPQYQELLEEGVAGPMTGRYLTQSGRDIQALGYLPGRESVEVLAKFLQDDRTGSHRGVSNAFDDLFQDTDIMSNSRLAVMALKILEVGPIPGAETFLSKGSATAKEAEIYKDWWAEVQTGKRDYHFGWKGWGEKKILPKEQWPPDPYARVPSEPKSPPPPAISITGEAAAKGSKAPAWALWSALVLVALALAVAFRKKSRRSASC